jgi:hypothetical protein
MKTFLSCLAIVTLLVLAWSVPAFCGEIHDATKVGNLEWVKALLKENLKLVGSRLYTEYDIGGHPAYKQGEMPLHLAAERGRKEIAEVLLDNGAKIDAKNNLGRTPLHIAAGYGQKAVLELLLARGADAGAKDNDGNTPLDAALMKGYQDVVKLLRQHGGNTIPRDGLIGEWLFSGDAKDTSGKENNGTIVGEVTLTRDRFGNDNRAYKFNGIDGYIKAKGDSLPQKDRTVSLWININSISTKPVFLAYGGGACGTSWFMGIGPTQHGGSPTVYYMTSHCDYNNIIYQFSYSPEEVWHHFVVETSASGTIMFLDGSKVASNTNYVNNTATVGTDLSMGVDISPSGCAPYKDPNVGYLYGSLDDVRVYNRALSESEIRSLYREGGWAGN